MMTSDKINVHKSVFFLHVSNTQWETTVSSRPGDNIVTYRGMSAPNKAFLVTGLGSQGILPRNGKGLEKIKALCSWMGNSILQRCRFPPIYL